MAKQRFTSAATEERLKTCLEEFQAYLEFHNKSPNTIRAYLFAVRQFYELYPAMNQENLILYKCYLIDHYKPQTVNLRIIERCSDIAMLSDILGHESIETTRIYLHRSSTEQQQIFNHVVNW